MASTRMRVVPETPKPRASSKKLERMTRPHQVIQKAMAKKQMTRRQLAEATGLSYSMVCNIVSNRRTIWGYQKQFEQALGIEAGLLTKLSQALLNEAVGLYHDALREARAEGGRYLRAEERRSRFKPV